MASQELEAYIHTERARGVAEGEIRAELLKTGWHKDDVDKALAPSPADDVTSAPSALRRSIVDYLAWPLLVVNLICLGVFLLTIFSIILSPQTSTDFGLFGLFGGWRILSICLFGATAGLAEALWKSWHPSEPGQGVAFTRLKWLSLAAALNITVPILFIFLAWRDYIPQNGITDGIIGLIRLLPLLDIVFLITIFGFLMPRALTPKKRYRFLYLPSVLLIVALLLLALGTREIYNRQVPAQLEDKGKIPVAARSEVKDLISEHGERVFIKALDRHLIGDEANWHTDHEWMKEHDDLLGMVLKPGLNKADIGCIIVVYANNKGYVYWENKDLNIIDSETLAEFKEHTNDVSPEIMSRFYLSLN